MRIPTKHAECYDMGYGELDSADIGNIYLFTNSIRLYLINGTNKEIRKCISLNKHFIIQSGHSVFSVTQMNSSIVLLFNFLKLWIT